MQKTLLFKKYKENRENHWQFIDMEQVFFSAYFLKFDSLVDFILIYQATQRTASNRAQVLQSLFNDHACDFNLIH